MDWLNVGAVALVALLMLVPKEKWLPAIKGIWGRLPFAGAPVPEAKPLRDTRLAMLGDMMSDCADHGCEEGIKAASFLMTHQCTHREKTP